MGDLVKLKMVYTGAVPGLAVREVNTIKRRAFFGGGVQWHKQFRPKHFTRAGASEYGYAPRSGERGNTPRGGFRRSYTGRKLKQFGHTRPLEFSGEAKALTRMRDVRATATRKRSRVRVVLHANKLNWRNPDSEINMADELRRISAAERTQLIRTIARGTISGLKRVQRRETKTIS